MNAEEAGRVLKDRPDEAVRNLVVQAEGWPALIGLAALTASREIPGERVSDALYRYFAEEVFRREPADVQRFMLLASVPVAVDARVSRDVLQIDDPEPTLDRLVEEGLLHPAGDQLRLHPLLRAFIKRKFETEEPDSWLALAKRAIGDARSQGHWEEAFELSMDAQDLEVAVAVLEDGTPELLATGRIETLERWLDECGSSAFDKPPVVLARAQVLVRKGRFAEASALAEDLVKRIPSEHHLAARAANAAGLSRYLRSQSDQARSYYERADELARSRADMKDALWGAFVSAVDLDVAGARPYLDRLEELEASDLNIRLRVATGRQVLATHAGTHEGLWSLIEPLIPLARYATDAVVRSNFLAQAAYLALARGEYEAALPLATNALEVSKGIRHDFAIASCLAYRAASEVGCRRLQAARQDVGDLSQIRATEEDPYLQIQVLLMRVRLALAEGDLPRAQALLEDSPRDPPDRATEGERLGITAIVSAAAGDVDRANAAAAQARKITKAVEATYYARFGDLIASLVSAQNADTADLRVGQLVSECERAEFLEAFVIAYRAHPSLLKIAGDAPETQGLVQALIRRAHDQALARRVGLRIDAGRREPPHSVLTRREREVLELISHGLSNAQIAKRLFISESTAKVHVHKVLTKLGVQSRLQAALLASGSEPGSDT
jgi:ATP/maltotriose-dependent transcriptional regulator MalT